MMDLIAGLLAFLDLKDQIDAIVRPLDDLRHHRDVETPVAMIDLDDALDVRLHRGARQGAACLGLDFLLQLLVLDARVALEGEPVDDRRFHHGDDEAAAGLGDADVFEQA